TRGLVRPPVGARPSLPRGPATDHAGPARDAAGPPPLRSRAGGREGRGRGERRGRGGPRRRGGGGEGIGGGEGGVVGGVGAVGEMYSRRAVCRIRAHGLWSVHFHRQPPGRAWLPLSPGLGRREPPALPGPRTAPASAAPQPPDD